MLKRCFLVGILLLFHYYLVAQISQGGLPTVIEEFDQEHINTIYMPEFKNIKSVQFIIDNFKNKHKPLKFAHAYNVDYTPKNSGEWIDLANGRSIWKLKIVSKGAKSINLIFDNFNLPKSGRLYIYNPEEKHYLGAFTALNNKPSKKFATAPIKGEQIIVQYEIDTKQKNNGCFAISKVNHDYVGILKDYNPRRPLNFAAGACNIDINCIQDSSIKNIRDAVCRIIVNGSELCTGTLINNTSNNKKPYIISAGHCYDHWEYPETSVYAFNYQSPFCSTTDLDGDPVQAISGARMISMSDSLDFALTELSITPPPEYHPFFAGWNRREELHDSSITIHHPYGDIKKIAFDDEAPTYSDFNSDYLPNAFLEVGRWENGVTEAGSSGAALFNANSKIIGTLTGGTANCSAPTFDYFSRMDLAWDYYSEDTLQLKKWLDPIGSNALSIDGERIYSRSEQCKSFTNLEEQDFLQNILIDENNRSKGYWGGNNTENITEFSERFIVPNVSTLNAISIGMGKIKSYHAFNPSKIEVKVYTGRDYPETEVFSKLVSINMLQQNAMNLISVDPAISIPDTFFVGYKLFGIITPDTVNILQSRNTSNVNYLYYKQNDNWINYQEANQNNKMINAIEVLCCNLTPTNIINKERTDRDIFIYPNPTYGKVFVINNLKIKIEHITVFDILGRAIECPIANESNNRQIINLINQQPGIYFIRVETKQEVITQKISYVP